MLIRDTAIYALGRVMPGLLNLVSLALYTRLLSPPDYGRYTLVIAGVIICNSVAFYWLRVAAVRQLPPEPSARPEYIGALYGTHLRVAAVVAVASLIAVGVIGPAWRGLVLVGALFLLSQSWFELNLDLSLASHKPARYALLATTRAFLSVSLGGLLAYAGYGPMGILAGSAAAFLIPAFPASWIHWNTARVLKPDPPAVRRIVVFGLPLAGAVSVGVFSNGVDRFVLGGFAGTQSVGQYAAAADLASQTAIVLMMIVSISALPTASRALALGGPAASTAQLARHGVLLVAMALPACVGLAFLAPQIATALLGPAFRDTATTLIPLIAIGTLLGGVKMFYFDIAIQLADATKRQLHVSVVGAVLSVGLNLWLIPIAGVRGAAYAMIVTFAVTCILSGVVAKQVFRVPLPIRDWARTLVAATVMLLALLPLRDSSGGVPLLALSVSWGFLVYLTAAIALDVGGSRRHVAMWLRRAWGVAQG